MLPWSLLWLSGAKPRFNEAYQIEGHNGIPNKRVFTENSTLIKLKSYIWLMDNRDILIKDNP